MEIKSIERFFLNTILIISMVGVTIILLSDSFFFPEDKISITIDVAILSACVASYLLRIRYHTVAVVTLTSLVLMTMVYQCLRVPTNTTTSLSIILVIGFVISVMLKGRVMWVMHGIAVVILNVIFIVQFLNPQLRFSDEINDVTTVAITYSILYFILNYGAAVLKSSYDRIHKNLREMNIQLEEKAAEIAMQNKNLEQIVNERTAHIQTQNEILIKYSFTNAHHLRGPVARLLGLASVYKFETNPDPDYFMKMMVDQAHEIDLVVKQINVDLEASNVDLNLKQ